MAEYRTHMKIIGDILVTTRDDLQDEDDLIIEPSQLLPDEQCHEYAYDNIFEFIASIDIFAT